MHEVALDAGDGRVPLVRADPRLAGMFSRSAARNGSRAARLAAASGCFPVPPVATTLGISEIERSPAAFSTSAHCAQGSPPD